MIDIPLNKALAAVENPNKEIDNRCKGCCLRNTNSLGRCGKFRIACQCGAIHVACQYDKRKDGKNVIFKLVDLPEEVHGESTL